MEVRSELSDVDDGRIDVGETGTCVLDAYPDDPIACTVAGITPVARIKGQNSLRGRSTSSSRSRRADPKLGCGSACR